METGIDSGDFLSAADPNLEKLTGEGHYPSFLSKLDDKCPYQVSLLGAQVNELALTVAYNILRLQKQ